MNKYEIEVTDLYGGELNYSWVKRYEIQAKSVLGAVQKLSRLTGGSHKFVVGDSDSALYHSVSGQIGVTINRVGE